MIEEGANSIARRKPSSSTPFIGATAERDVAVRTRLVRAERLVQLAEECRTYTAELMRASRGGVLCRPWFSGSVLYTQNRDVNDPGSGARGWPRAPSGSFTSRFGASS